MFRRFRMIGDFKFQSGQSEEGADKTPCFLLASH